MIIHEDPSPNSVSSPVSTAKDSRCYTVEDLMEMLLLSRPGNGKTTRYPTQECLWDS